MMAVEIVISIKSIISIELYPDFEAFGISFR